MTRTIRRGYYATNVLMNADNYIIEKIDKTRKNLENGGKHYSIKKSTTKKLTHSQIDII